MNPILLFYRLRPLEHIVALFYSAIILAMCAVNTSVPFWYAFVLLDIVIIYFMFQISNPEVRDKSTLHKIIAYWYPAPLILLTFKQIYFLIRPVRGAGDYDHLLIAFDRMIFGADPTHVLYAIANPVLTELLQIAYALFYVLPIILAWALFLKNRKLETEYVIFATVYGFFISYIGYFLLPAVGPRFTLHNFAMNDIELPGLWLTQALRFVVNTGESIPPGTPNPVLFVQRDVFPSGHTMMTAMVMYLAVRYKSNVRFFILITGALLIFATVYLRYHYVADVAAGLVFMLFALWSGEKYFNFIKRNLNVR